MNYILSYANLIAIALNIPENRNLAQVTEMAQNAKANAYVPRKIKVVTPEEEKAQAG